MASVWYVGKADKRTITDAQWTAAGFPGVGPDVWDRNNGWSIPAVNFTVGQLDVLDDHDGFVTDAPDGPRPDSPATVPQDEPWADDLAALSFAVNGKQEASALDVDVSSLIPDVDSDTRAALLLFLSQQGGGGGADGRGITNITRTAGNGAPGTVDVYTITYTDTTTSTFDVYNGADGIVPQAAIDAAVAEAMETHTPGIELGTAVRTTSFTSTGNALIPGLSITITGNGRPVTVSFYCPRVWFSVANTYTSGRIFRDGVQAADGAVLSPSTAAGPSLYVELPEDPIPVGQQRTYTVQAFLITAGTMTFYAAANSKMSLRAVSR